jgi:hypothetical protein
MSDAILWALKELVVAYAVYLQLPGGIAEKIQVSTACVPAEIRTENIPNASLHHYHYPDLFAKMCIFGYLAT